jgi:hypothetical protein
MEGWLLNKLSIFVNPTTAEFEREAHYKGCLIIQTYEGLQDVVDRFYGGETIQEYEALQPERDKILHDTIGYADGKNYKRAASIIMECLPKAKRVSRLKMIKAFFRKDFIAQTFRYYLWQWNLYFKLRPKLTKPASLYPYEKNKIEKYEKMYENISYE